MNDLTELIHSAARRHQISPQIIAAVIFEESRGKQWRTRFETHWFRKLLATPRENLIGYVPPESVCSGNTERAHRATSWGLMQVLGETARERGFKGESLTLLLDQTINVEIGCGYLAHLIALKGDEEAGVLAYNGGGDDQYALRIYSHIDEGRIEEL